MIPGDWLHDALCAQVDPDMWWPTPDERNHIGAAKRICRRCPVRVECAAWAAAGDKEGGVWAGRTNRRGGRKTE